MGYNGRSPDAQARKIWKVKSEIVYLKQFRGFEVDLRCPERDRDIGYRLRTRQKGSQVCTGVRDPL